MTDGPHRLPGKPGHLREPDLPKLRPFKVGRRYCHVCGDHAHAVNYRCGVRTSACGDPRPHLHDECSRCGLEWVTRTYENRRLWERVAPGYDVFLALAVIALLALAAVLIVR